MDGLRITNMTRSKIHRVAVLAMHGVVPFDLGIPCETFGRLKIANRNAYRVRVCGEARHVKAGFFDLRAQWDLSDLLDADTIVVPGLADIAAPISREVVSALRAAKRRGIRVASICTGAFVLAAAGLLDGRRATTHWLAAPALAARFPAVEIDANVLYVDNEDILTSDGAAAGLDMCLHIVRRDFGASAAANAARLSVMPLERAGGQAQFIVHETPASVTTLEPVLRWMEEHIAESLTLEDIASKAGTSARTLSRRFLEQTGTTPAQWVVHVRICRAQHLLETTDFSVERVASEVGFESVSSFRERFGRQLHASPASYRRAFRNVARTHVEAMAS